MEIKSRPRVTVIINLYGCDQSLIKSKQVIQDFAIQLCKLLNLQRTDDLLLTPYSDDERRDGIAVIQSANGALITGNFVAQDERIYLDILCIEQIDLNFVSTFCQDFFKAQKWDAKLISRELA